MSDAPVRSRLALHESAERTILSPLGLSAGAEAREMSDLSRLERHLMIEERSIFPLLDALLGDDRSHRMGSSMERAVEGAPCRI